jgi:hypothetical protein
MRDELAERLLAAVMHWEEEQVVEVGSQLQALARHKYDRYGGFRPGERFLESLAQWLQEFKNYKDREHALEFVLGKLIFIKGAELNHLIEMVYPDILRPRLISRVSTELGCPSYQVARITCSLAFRALQRRMLIIGLSDGSRLDLLRRACPELSHEQFWLSPDQGDDAQRRMRRKLDEALNQFGLTGTPRTFSEIVLAEDFSGSGITLLRRENQLTWDGKLAKVHDWIEELKEHQCVDANARVLLIVYIASSQAAVSLRKLLSETSWGWDLKPIQLLPESAVVTDRYIRSLCEEFFDGALADSHKGRTPLGYNECALPLVLEHNTPNNSLSLLWADTSNYPMSTLHRHALFPRYERHHKDRP